MRTFVRFVGMLLVATGAATGADQAPTFHGIKLGVSLGSQFQECPWNPPKEGDIPQYISPPDKDDKGNTIPCFHEYLHFKLAAYPQVVWSVQLFEDFQLLKDAQGNVLSHEPSFPGLPTINITVLVPASTLLRDGTIEEVTLSYLPVESDRVRDALIKKFGASHPCENKLPIHPCENKMSPKMMEWFGIKTSDTYEVWETEWGQLSLRVTDKFVAVFAKTSKLIRFQRENGKDEF